MRSSCREAEFAADFNREQEGTVKSQRPTRYLCVNFVKDYLARQLLATTLITVK